MSVFLYVYAHTHVCMHAYIKYMYVHTYIYMPANIHICIDSCMSAYKHT